MELTIIIPCFNERATVAKAIEEAKALKIDKEIIVIDNCSTDGSREILEFLNDRSLQIVYQPRNYGYGQSVKTGISLSRGNFIYVQYSDLEYGIECVYGMIDIAKKENLDAVFGSRLYDRRRNIFALIKERPYYLGTIIATFLINLLYGRRFSDIIGTRLYRSSSIKNINIASSGMSFDFEVVSKLCKNRLKTKEVPVTYKPRSVKEGKKIKPMDIIPAILTIFKIKFSGKA